MEEFKVMDKVVLDNEHICSNCKKYLNVTPIYCVERNKTIEELCGRCIKVADGFSKSKKWRQYLFEDFGKHLTFPCSHKKYGCSTVLRWDDVLSHEKECNFRGTSCPLAQERVFPEDTCTWEGNIKDLQNHIEESHKDLIFNPLQIDWCDYKENLIYFTSVGTQIVTVLIKYHQESTYQCLVMVNGSDLDSQCYRYQLELFDETKSNSIILRKSRLESILSLTDNLCDSDKMLEVNLTKVKEMLKKTNLISGRFGIVKKPKKEIALITGDKNYEIVSAAVVKPKENNIILDEKILQELECPVCNEYMIPPIYICKTGHSICSICKPKVNMCPNCRDNFSGTRNFTLEKLTARVNYPCRNRDIGCSYVTTSDKILNHQANCELSEQPCMLQCGWQGMRCSMYHHLKALHVNSICDIDTLQICDVKDTNETFSILYYQGELFRYSFKQDFLDSAKKFNIQQVGTSRSDPEFRYQLQIIDHSPLGLNLSFTNVCRKLTDLKTAHNLGIVLPWNLLQPLIFEERYYYYKILIERIQS